MFFPASHDVESSSSSSESRQLCRQFTLSEIQLATRNFDELLVIGRGGFGKVYKGTITNGLSISIVAIKRLDSTSNQGASEFWAEVNMLSNLRHCHLVSLIGYCNDGQEMILVYEYISNGTLEDHLHRHQTHLSWVQRLTICLGAARGLDYLHTGTGIKDGVVHRDVKSSNILLHDSWAAKISDFGLSKTCPKKQHTTYVNTGVKGTFGYLDPDYFYSGKLTIKTDVYAFGVILFEVLCGKRAVDRSIHEEQWGLAAWAQNSIKEGKLKQIVDTNIRGSISPICLKDFAKLAKRCLHKHPKRRPTMAEVVVSLESVVALEEKANNTLQSTGIQFFAKKALMVIFPSKEKNTVGIGQNQTLHRFGSETINVATKNFSEAITIQQRNTNPFSYKGILQNGQGEQIVAGWPSWLAEVAGAAINGWLPRRADTFEKLDKIGQGRYSNVYKARDLISNKIVALKRVQFDSQDLESVVFMAREILIFRRLDHPNIIKLEGVITSQTSRSLYLVFEYMEHDLTGLVTLPGVKFTESQVKCYMNQLLNGLDHCHSHGVLHRDIKGSNLLIDNNGILKIADFGLANFFKQIQTVPLTSRVVTLWYRPPELLLGATHYGVGVDLWSAGCILGELYAGKPIMPGRTEVEQLHRIFKLCGSPPDSYWIKSKLPHSTAYKPVQPYKRRILEVFKDFPPAAIGLMQTLLAIDPEERGTAALALKSEFFTTKPLACDPSSLPQYPPSKEIDAKRREEEAKRQRAARMNGQKLDKESGGAQETGAVPAHDANAELARSTRVPVSIQPPKGLNDGAKRSPPMRGSYSGQLAAGVNSAQSKAVAYKDIPSQPKKYLQVPQNMGGPCRVGSGRASMNEANMDGDGYKGNKIQFSGPLVSSKVDQMIKDHDRHIQQAARRAHLERTRLSEVEAEMARNKVYPSSQIAK